MRKDGKSQYTIKKEKLLEIKKILQEIYKITDQYKSWYEEDPYTEDSRIKKMWEIVKDEK